MIYLCHIEDLSSGTARGFDPDHSGQDTVFLVRRPEGIRAYLNRCPHQGVPLEYRKDRFLSADGERVLCFAHGAHFDADTGVCVQGPCLGQSLQAVRCHVENGRIWLDRRRP